MPLWLFDERKHVAICLPFSSRNEKYCSCFINKLVFFTSGKVKFTLFGTHKKFSRYSH